MPPERIAEGARDLQALLGEHGFLPGVAGHASAGNLHFMLTPDFAKPEDLDRYEAFMGELVELIVDKYDGSLKAEHGTGINMAPYVEREWGEKATELMWRVKRLADPDGVLAPGVVLNRDPGAHLRNLKTTPAIEESATTCVECGFCEPVCPSRNLTTTPRQRIVLRREMARQPDGLAGAAGAAGGVRVRRRSRPAPPTAPASSPARSGSTPASWSRNCASAAPHRAGRSAGARRRAKRWGAVEARLARPALRVGGPLARRTKRGRGAAAAPAPAKLPATAREGAAAVYVPSCTNRIFGRGGSGPSLAEALVAVSRARRAAGLDPRRRRRAAAAGCPGARKGFGAAHRHKANEMVERLWRWSGEGELPVVIDAASCTHGDRRARRRASSSEANAERLAELEILDSVAWAHDRLLPALEVSRKVGSATVHPTCATRHMGLAPPARAARRRPRRRRLRRPLGRPAAASPATAASPTPS